MSPITRSVSILMRAVSGPCWPFKIAGAAAIAATNFRLVRSILKTLTAILLIFAAGRNVRESTREDHHETNWRCNPAASDPCAGRGRARVPRHVQRQGPVGLGECQHRPR